ncbi:MAG: DNA (cytosine-5-)-methyltransferase [Nitrospirota bacterium]|nr:DNA (cytosine-5-)-methyltransferase [Nitrospirota bacterium]
MNMTGTNLRLHRQQLGLSQANLAELSGISQHILSAFELGKTDLPQTLRETVSQALANKKMVATLAEREKRYRQHKYVEVPKLPERVTRAARTIGNTDYCRCLDKMATQSAQKNTGGMTALSLFSGCGGFSIGFSAAGFIVKGYLELEVELRTIYKLNFPDSIELGGDITEISSRSLANFSERIGAIDVIIGGPPCQGFSLSGKRQIDDPRNILFKHYLRFVEAFRPKVAVLENVRLLTSMKNPEGRLVKDQICEEFRKHGYKIRSFEINAKDYGVPQHRERVMFIAVRNDISQMPSLPEKTHGQALHMFSSALPYRTFADACSDLAFIESGEKSTDDLHEAVRHPAHVIEWLWDVPEGCSAHDNEDPNKRPPSGYNTTYKRQVWTEPASTVQTTFGMISGCRNVHPIATRSLTIREAARIQSFPDSYKFSGSLGAIRTGIGNAVPPLLAYQIACHIKNLLNFVKVPRL